MTPLADLADRLTRASRLYRAACDGAILMGPGGKPFAVGGRSMAFGTARLVWPLPEDDDTREALRLRVRALERQVAAESGRYTIRLNGAGRARR